LTIVVVGGGAIGLLVAGRLAQSPQHVALLDRAPVADTLRSHSIRISRGEETDIIETPPVAGEPAALPEAYHAPDLAIVCVKGYDTAAALDTLEALRPQQVLTLQNGIGHEETLTERLGAGRVLAGAVTSSVEVEAPGHIRITRVGGIGLAAVGNTPGMVMWGAVLGKAGFIIHKYHDYRALKWSKALLNMLGNATPAILDMPIAAVYANRHLAALERQAFLEALTVMQRRGIAAVNLPSYPVKRLAMAMHRLPSLLLFPLLRRVIAGGRGGKRPSLHIDLQRGRTASEGAFLYGAVAHAAREEGLTAPVNTALWQVLHGIASCAIAWDTFRQQPDRLLDVVRQTASTAPHPAKPTDRDKETSV
jgi:2-dehydropantoate 2-reductase